MFSKNFTQIFFVFLLFCFFIFLLSPMIAFSQDWEGELKRAAPAALKERNIDITIGAVIQAVLSFVGVIFLILLIYGGVMWMVARGAEEKVTKAKNTIEAAVIGIIIVLAAYAISIFVMRAIVGVTEVSACPEGQEACVCEPADCPEEEMCFESICISEGAACPDRCP